LLTGRGSLQLETGKLIFHSKNCHIYQRQYKLVQELLSPQSTTKTPRMAQAFKTAEKEQDE
jgi:thymidylate synthase